LADASGSPLEMPTDFDDFSPRAHRGTPATPAARANAERLESAMVAEGFEPLPPEGWHFDAPRWQADRPLAVPLGRLVWKALLRVGGSGHDLPTEEFVVPEPLSSARILEIARGFMSSKVLFVAAKLHLFDELGDGPLTGDEIRGRLGLHPRAIPDFLDALV